MTLVNEKQTQPILLHVTGAKFEKRREYVTFGLGFTSDSLIKWRTIF